MSKVDPVAVRVATALLDRLNIEGTYDAAILPVEAEVLARVVLAAAEVCSHKDIKRVIIDAHVADDIDALAKALEGGTE